MVQLLFTQPVQVLPLLLQLLQLKNLHSFQALKTPQETAMLCCTDCEDKCQLLAYHCIYHFLYGVYALHVGWVVLFPPWLCRGKSAGTDLQSAVQAISLQPILTSSAHPLITHLGNTVMHHSRVNSGYIAPSSEVCSILDLETEGRDLRALHCLRGFALRR